MHFLGVTLQLPTAHANSRGQSLEPYKIKLIYAGNYPIILFHSLLQQLYMLARVMGDRGHNNWVCRINFFIFVLKLRVFSLASFWYSKVLL